MSAATRASAREPSAAGADPASPCVNVCTMDSARGLCTGCRRTLDEIAHWSSYTRAEKLAVLEKVAQRGAQDAAGRAV